MIHHHMTDWFGLRVEEFTEGATPSAGKIHRLGFSYDDESFTPQVLAAYLDHPGAAEMKAISLGMPGESGETFSEVIKVLVDRAPKLPALRGIFLGDIIGEENEMSWIEQGDVGLILAAFPQLEELRVRGGSSLVLTACDNPGLKRLYIETGGMPATVLRDLACCRFPQLQHLELWLGEESYGWNGSVDDILPVIDPGVFPELKSLALKNSEIQNEIAELMAKAPIVKTLEYLDLSDGTMTDEGAEKLLASDLIRGLTGLDLHRNFLTEATTARLKTLCPKVDVSAQEEPDGDYYYIAVGE